MNKSVALSLLGCWLVGSDLSLAESIRPQTAKYAVGIWHLEYVDVQRNQRPMVLDIYPAAGNPRADDLYVTPVGTGFKVYKNRPVAFAGEKYPLILLSHGRSGNRFNLAWLAAFLASRGYIVGSMDHAFPNGYYLSFEYVASKIWERPRDVSRHITHLLNHRWWSRYIDGSKIAVAGHSQGGMTALWIGGAKINAGKFENYQRGGATIL